MNIWNGNYNLKNASWGYTFFTITIMIMKANRLRLVFHALIWRLTMSALATKTFAAPNVSSHRADVATADRTEEAARYIGQMVGEMALIAREAKLELLAYFLEMARIEAYAAQGRTPR